MNKLFTLLNMLLQTCIECVILIVTDLKGDYMDFEYQASVIGDDSLGDYLSNGLFYKMSDTSIQKDGNAIGWHPKWNELFNGNNNG